jgi:hypothetical protein
VDTGRSRHELTRDVNDIRNVRMSDIKIDKATDKVMLASVILKRDTVRGTKMSVKLHRIVQLPVRSRASISLAIADCHSG